MSGPVASFRVDVAGYVVALLNPPDRVVRTVESTLGATCVDLHRPADISFEFSDRLQLRDVLEASEVGLSTPDGFYLFDRHAALAELPDPSRDLPWRLHVEERVAAGFFVPNVLVPSIHLALQRRGATLVHAGAVVSPEGDGVLMPAWGGVGKTSTLLALALRDGFHVLADDLAAIDRDGMIHPFVRTVNVLDYNLKDFPDLRRHFSGKARAASLVRAGLVRARDVSLRMWGSDSLAAAAASRFSQLAKALANAKVPLRSLERAGSSAGPTRTKAVLALQRSTGTNVLLERVSPDWIARSSAVTIEDEFEKFARGYRAAVALRPGTTRPDIGAEKVLREVLSSLPCYRLMLPSNSMRTEEAALAVKDILRSHGP